jgi:hypothetical protein
MNNYNKWYSNTNEYEFISSEGKQPNPDDKDEGIRYVKFTHAGLPNESRKRWEIINMIRGYARALEGTRICYEQHNAYGGKYTLIVPKMEPHAISSLETLGVDLVRGYKVLSRKYKRKHFQKIRL